MTLATVLPPPPSLFAYLSSLFLGATRLDSLSQVDKEGQEERGAERDSWGWKYAIRNKKNPDMYGQLHAKYGR